ncbi:MAG: DUF4369 domain-containing protein [Bacteroidales bacterium]|nr:DUF4369 domain-containing protein [Bacteroidales bacterium]
MKKISTGFLLVWLFLSCTADKTFVIEGTLPHSKYNGELVFLLPFAEKGSERVDSVLVENKTFRFEGKADSAEVWILRMRHLLRMDIQEHLIMIEPGNIWVQLDSVSSSGGTPQNDKLQEWKEARLKSHKITHLLWTMSRQASHDSIKQQIRSRWEQENTAFKEFSRRFAQENKGTEVARFVLEITDP